MANIPTHFTLVNLAPQERERLEKRAAQELKINSLVIIPSVLAVGVIVFYCNSAFLGQEVLLEIINGVGGLAGGVLIWYYVRFLLNFRKDIKSGKKKSAVGIVEGKRIHNEGKLSKSHRMLFNKTEYELTPEVYKLVQKGMKIELHLTEHTERVIGIKKLL